MEANRLRVRKTPHERAEASERDGRAILVVETDGGGDLLRHLQHPRPIRYLHSKQRRPGIRMVRDALAIADRVVRAAAGQVDAGAVLQIAQRRESGQLRGQTGTNDGRVHAGAGGLDDAQIGRLKAPIGLDLGASTPWEVALSVAAEIIESRRDVPISARYERSVVDLLEAEQAR